MQHKYWSYLQTSPSANKTVFILYSFLYPAQHFTLLIGWPVRLYVCIEPCAHEQLCICIIHWLSIMPTECCPPRRYRSLLSLLVPWTPLFHEQLCHEEAGYLRRSYLCRTDPPRQHRVSSDGQIKTQWSVLSSLSPALLSASAAVAWWDQHSDVCLPRENGYLWLSKLDTYGMGGSCRTCVSQSHQKSKWKGWRNGCWGGISLGEGP